MNRRWWQPRSIKANLTAIITIVELLAPAPFKSGGDSNNAC
jgi:hypothetical protein